MKYLLILSLAFTLPNCHKPNYNYNMLISEYSNMEVIEQIAIAEKRCEYELVELLLDCTDSFKPAIAFTDDTFTFNVGLRQIAPHPTS